MDRAAVSRDGGDVRRSILKVFKELVSQALGTGDVESQMSIWNENEAVNWATGQMSLQTLRRKYEA